MLVHLYVIRSVDHFFVFDIIPHLAVGLFSIIIFILVAYRDRREYKTTGKGIAFIASFAEILSIASLVVTVYFLNQRDNSPSKLHCVTRIIDFNGVSIDFREDGTYKLTSWCMGADIYRGQYRIDDSVITLDKNKIEHTIVSSKLVIGIERVIYKRDSIPGMDTFFRKYVYQIDAKGKRIEHATDFIVLDTVKSYGNENIRFSE